LTVVVVKRGLLARRSKKGAKKRFFVLKRFLFQKAFCSFCYWRKRKTVGLCWVVAVVVAVGWLVVVVRGSLWRGGEKSQRLRAGANFSAMARERR